LDITNAGNAEAEKTASGDAPEKTDSKVTPSVEKRFAELTGEINRRKEKEERLVKELETLKDKLKTEDEKRIEALASAKFEPVIKEYEEVKAALAAERDALLANIPEEYSGLYVSDESIPLYKQIKQLQNIIALSTNKKPSTATPGANAPGTEKKARYTKEQFQNWQRLAASINTVSKYNEMRDEMVLALKEGRVDGI